jgi:hypothetical protein
MQKDCRARPGGCTVRHPMKALPLLLAASLVANAATLTWVFRHEANPAGSDGSPSASTGSVTAGKSATSPAGPKVASADVLEQLRSGSPESLRDLLRAAGVPDETVRMIVGSAIWKRYSEQMKALRPKPDANKPWWKDNNDWYGNMTAEQRSEMRRLQREAQEESIRILGKDKDNQGWGWQDTRYSFLPDEKRKSVQDVEQDYQDLIQEVQQDMNGFALPSDQEKIRFLMEEKKRDLAALLTPEELADYDLRMSRTAQQLRWKMTKFDASEDEYRKIFAAQKAFDDSQSLDAWGNPMDRGPDSWKKRQEGEKQVAEQIKAALGAERYAEYVRSQNHEYQQLQTATKRLSLPPETANNVFNLRYEVAAESKRIADNKDIDYDQKIQQLAALAQKTRDQVRTQLGEEASGVYLKSGMNWLDNVAQGNVIKFDEQGQQQGWDRIQKPPKKPVPAAAK